MVRGESVVTALIGAALGLPLGIGMAALATHSLSEWGVRARCCPVGTLVAFVVVAIVVGVIAAVAPGPARQPARRPAGAAVRVALRSISDAHVNPL